MHDRLCHQYITGICTRQSFHINNLTQTCTLLHDTGKKSLYSNDIVYENDKRVFEEYDLILKENCVKVEMKKRILKERMGYSESEKNNEAHAVTLEDMLSATEMIFNHSIQNPNKNRRAFLKIWAKILKLENSSRKEIFKVCSICSHIHSQECDHIFHESYVQLGKVHSMLKKKLEREGVIPKSE